MIVLLDTNVVLRWVNPLDAQHSEASAAVESVQRAGHRPAIAPQVLYELWVVATRPEGANGFGKSTAEARALIEQLAPTLIELLPDNDAIFPTWLDLVTRYQVRGKPAHDARLVAAMVSHGVTHVVTFNEGDFARYGEITAVSPAAVLAGKL